MSAAKKEKAAPPARKARPKEASDGSLSDFAIRRNHDRVQRRVQLTFQRLNDTRLPAPKRLEKRGRLSAVPPA